MADETQGVQNKGLLLIAILLALVVLVVYNFHIIAVKKSGQGEQLRVAQYKRAIRKGKIVDANDIIGVDVDVLDPKALGNVVLYEQRDSIIGQKLIQDVRVDQFVVWGHTLKNPGQDVDNMITRGKVAVPIEIESSSSPGPILTSDGRVNLVGRFTLRGQAERAYMIMENVRVIAVGDQPGDQGMIRRGSLSRSSGSYRRITIELTSEEHRRLLDVLSHIGGHVVLEVLNRDEAPPEAGGIVDEALVQALRAGGGSSRGRGGR